MNLTKVNKIIIILIPTAIILFAAMIILLTSTIMKNVSNMQYYDMAGDQIVSINHVVGERKVSSVQSRVSNSVLYKQYTYYGMESTIEDIQKYINYLEEKDSFILYSELDPSIIVGQVSLGKKSSLTGKDILITITYEIGSYTISLERVVN